MLYLSLAPADPPARRTVRRTTHPSGSAGVRATGFRDTAFIEQLCFVNSDRECCTPSVLKRGADGSAGAEGTAEATSDAELSMLTCCLRALRGSCFSDNSETWVLFRHLFFQGILGLWTLFCTFIVVGQFAQRMAYSSLRVFGFGWVTCLSTGLGALPFAFVDVDAVEETLLAITNAVVGGMMLAASVSMLQEAHEHCGVGDWQIFVGILVGGLFVRAAEAMQGEEGGIEVLHKSISDRAHFKKAMLIFTVMFCHSAAEGVAVGVAFSKQLREEVGLYVTILLAVHNVPEGLAVALVLVPRGVSVLSATGIAILTSVPQPLLALAAFLFVDTFQWLLPLGLAFAAGAMFYVCFSELFREALEQMGWARTCGVSLVSYIAMHIVQSLLHGVLDGASPAV